MEKRLSGVLLHITSLPSKNCIGDLGEAAYNFVDFLSKSGFSYWQVLPLNAVFNDPSPYFSISSFANNFNLISIDRLADCNLIEKNHLSIHISDKTKADFNASYSYKETMLKKAYSKFMKVKPYKMFEDYTDFCNDNKHWLYDYALFISIREYLLAKRLRDKKQNNLTEYDKFKEKYKDILDEDLINKYFYEVSICSFEETLLKRYPETLTRYEMLLSEKMEYHKFVQFIFYTQWKDLHKYAESKNIKIIGDIPIFVNYDSVDVWVNPELFYLDENFLPSKVAGVPPDYFSATGQVWNNPLYNWEIHKKTGYKWWSDRFEYLSKIVDIIRIDHFRAFDAYWAIPFGEKTAINGHWENGPKSHFFKTIFKDKKYEIIAEDLGLISEDVRHLRREFNMPGMIVSHFHFFDYNGWDSLQNFEQNSVIYTGTHDNQTSLSWFNDLPYEKKEHIASFVRKRPEDFNTFDLINMCAGSNVNTFILPIQDILGLDDKSRMNTPGTTDGNWSFRFKKESLTDELALRMYNVNAEFNRLNRD